MGLLALPSIDGVPNGEVPQYAPPSTGQTAQPSGGLLGNFMDGRQEVSNDLNNWMNEALDGLLGNSGIQDRLKLAHLLFNPAINVDQASRHTRTALDPSVRGADRALAVGQGALELFGLAIPAIASRLTPRLPGQNLGDEAARAMTETFANVSSRPEAAALRDFGASESGAIRAYHGSPRNFDKLSSDDGPLWFSNSKGYSQGMAGQTNLSKADAGNLYEVDLAVKNPLIVDVQSEARRALDDAGIDVSTMDPLEIENAFTGGQGYEFLVESYSGAASAGGNDAILFKGTMDGFGRETDQYVIFDDKLATIRSKNGERLKGLLDDEDATPPSGLLGDAAASPTMVDVYDARAAQMELPPANRIQPEPNRTRIVDAEYQTPPPGEVFPEGINRYPRNPDPSAPLPKGDRGRILVEKREELAKAMAEKIRKTGQLGSDTQFFYHSDGPIYRAAKNAGLTDPEAKDFLRDFSQSFAATSPRTKVEENLRNASSAMAKQAAGIPHRQIVGPGSGGISERGYPMMTGEPGGIHGQLLDQVYDTGGIDINKNPKPANFGANMAGDRSGVTVDTHAVRGTLQTLNEMYPGSVPDGYILPKYKEAYKADPSILTPNMLDDRPASQMVTLNGERVKAQTEYPVFADIFHGAADDLGVSPAEAQSMAWFGFGDQTNLGSAHKTVADVLDERISVTAQAMGITPDEAARLYFRRAIPLMGVAGGGLGLLGAGEARKPEQEGLL